jgi:hypothetical protein
VWAKTLVAHRSVQFLPRPRKNNLKAGRAVYQQRSGVLLLSSRDEALRNVDEQLALASAVEHQAASGRLPKGF